MREHVSQEVQGNRSANGAGWLNPLTWFMNILGLSIGIGPKNIAQVSAAEKVAACRYAIGPLLGATMVFVSFFLTLQMVYGGGQHELAHAGVAMLVASCFYLFDTSFISKMVTTQGERLIEERGMGRKLKDLAKFAAIFRVALSIVLAATVGTLLMLVVWSSDVNEVLLQWHEEANTEHVAAANANADSRIQTIEDELARLDARKTVLVASFEQEWQAQAEDAGLAPQVVELERLRAELAEARKRVRRHNKLKSAEREGAHVEGTSGAKGKGRQYRFHEAQEAFAQEEAAQLVTTIARLETDIAGRVEAAGAAEARRSEERARARAEFEAAISGIDAQRLALSAEKVGFLDDREAWIVKTVELAAGYQPLQTSLSSRLKALEKVYSSSGLVFFVAVGLKLLIVLIDLSAIVLHLLGGAPKQSAFLEAQEVEYRLSGFEEEHHQNYGEFRRKRAERLKREAEFEAQAFFNRAQRAAYRRANENPS